MTKKFLVPAIILVLGLSTLLHLIAPRSIVEAQFRAQTVQATTVILSEEEEPTPPDLTMHEDDDIFDLDKSLVKSEEPANLCRSPEGDGNTVIVRVYYPDLDVAREVFISFEGAMLETNYEGGYHVMQVTRYDIARLTGAGLRVEMDNEWKAPQPWSAQINAIPGYPCYRTVEETFASAQSLAADYPNLATWTDVGDSWEKTAGLGGYDMMVLRLTNSAISGPKPKLFITGAIHAREYTTAELVTRFAEYLVSNYGADADATWLLDHHEIHLMLHTNPDGRKQAETGLLWRKNTNRNYCGPTSNYRGADLNRNFDFQWGCCGGSSPYQCDQTYRGPSPASEPETQVVQDYVLAQFPDQRGPDISDPAPDDATGLYIDVHSYSELVLWPWGFTGAPTGNGTQLQTLGRKFAYWNSYWPEQAIGLYPTDGTTDDFVYGELGVAAYTFELGTTFFQDCATFENTIVPDNMPALIYAAKVARTPYMTPAGPDVYNLSLSADPVPAGTPVTLNGVVDDTRYNHSNGAEPTQNITAAEYYVDAPPWVAAPPPVPIAMLPSDGSFDSSVENVVATVDTTGLSAGQHIIFVRGKDAHDNWGAFSAILLNVTVPRTCWIRLNDAPTDYATVQAAVDAANGGDVVKVAGYCTGVEARVGVTQTVYLSKTLAVQGGYTTTNWITPDSDANPTTLDAQGQGRVLYITGAITPTIENLHVTGGDARLGGGMYVVTATAIISNCTVQDNTAQDKEDPFNDGYGGGLFLSHSDATLINNTVRNNMAVNRGGGLFLDGGSATLTNNTVQSNRAGSGGGLYLDDSAATLINNTVQDNIAAHSPSGSYSGAGGGLFLSHSAATLISNTVQNNTGGGSRSGRGGGLLLEYSNATLISNTVQNNSAPGWVNSEGGGLFLDHSDAMLINNLMRENSTNDWGWSRNGGGLFLGESAAALSGNIVISNTSQNGGGLYLLGSDAMLTNTIVADNQANSAGSGLYISDSSPQLLHVTIARNGSTELTADSGGGGSGVYVTNDSIVALTNTILVSHTVGITVAADNTVTLEATLWGTDNWGNGADWGGAGTIITGTVNLWGEPAFLDSDSGDYHIGPDSVAIDTGVNASVTADIDGEPRPAGDGYDIGADEVQSTNTPPTICDLPNQVFDETTSLPSTIDLSACVWDAETPDGLSCTIEGAPPAGAGVILDDCSYVTINPSASWCGYTDVTIRVTDPSGLWDSDTFRVAVTWSCSGSSNPFGAPILMGPLMQTRTKL